MTATVRIISRTQGGKPDEIEATISQYNERGMWASDKIVRARLFGGDITDLSFRDRGLHGITDSELPDVQRAVWSAEHADMPD